MCYFTHHAPVVYYNHMDMDFNVFTFYSDSPNYDWNIMESALKQFRRQTG